VGSTDQISERAMALGPDADRAKSVTELIGLASAEPGPLEAARDVLVRRIRIRSDDYVATSGLSLINAALGQVGWPAESTWEPRKGRRHGTVSR
jgi:hypothetical protein